MLKTIRILISPMPRIIPNIKFLILSNFLNERLLDNSIKMPRIFLIVLLARNNPRIFPPLILLLYFMHGIVKRKMMIAAGGVKHMSRVPLNVKLTQLVLIVDPAANIDAS